MPKHPEDPSRGPGPLPDYGEPDPETGLEPQDLEQIRWMLSLTPIERLRYAQRFAPPRSCSVPVEPDFLAILEILDRHGVELVICGGIAAILHGAPIMTADLDVVYAATEENCRRLLAATGELEAVYFDVARRRIVPDLPKLQDLRMHLLETNRGRLDLMREIGTHTNPDGQRIGGTHLHVYREGYEARWAVPLDSDEFPNPANLEQALLDFCRYCSIEQPTIQATLP